jgi:hypothetical protein
LAVEFLMSVVRLEYRNVTMRFARSDGPGVLTALNGVRFEVHDSEVVAHRPKRMWQKHTS